MAMPPFEPWVARVTRHLPEVHVPPHLMPPPPQLFASLCSSTHSPEQTLSPLGQTHEPCVQTYVFAQTLPHVPQFETLVSSSTQTLLQSVLPAGQTHAPVVH